MHIFNKKGIIGLTLFSLIALGASWTYLDKSERSAYQEMIQKYTANSDQYICKDLKELPKLDRPDMAALQNFVATIDPQLGRVPHERLTIAQEQSRQIAKNRHTDQHQALAWSVFNSTMGGRTRSMLFLPENNNEVVLAGSVTGGLYKSSGELNSESSWDFIESFMPNLSVGCMAYDPNNTGHIYVGTGEAQTARIIYRESSGVGAGIFYSSDNGENWEQIESTANFKYITDLIIRDENGVSVIYAGVASGYYHGDQNSEPSSGLYRSDDQGETWEQLLPEIPGTSPIQHFTPSDIELTSDGKIYVGTMVTPNRKGGGVVFSSISGLAGTWEKDASMAEELQAQGLVPARVILSSCQDHPEIVYSIAAGGYLNQENDFYYYKGAIMKKTLNAGSSWTNLGLPAEDWATLAWHAFMLNVHPNNPNKVYTGGLDLWQSLDGGTNWARVSDWSLMYSGGGPQFVHADQHRMLCMPGNPDMALFSTDGGVFISENAWEQTPNFKIKNHSYNTLQYYTCATAHTPDDDVQYLGGLQDNGTTHSLTKDIGLENMIDGGDGAFCFIDDDDPEIMITSVYYNSYTYYQDGERIGGFYGGSGTFISPADYSSKTNTLYTNAVSFKGDDPGSLIRAKDITTEAFMPELIEVEPSTGLAWFSALTASDFAPEGTDNLFLGTSDGRLFKATHAESTPEVSEITGDDFPFAYLSSIAIGGSEDTLMVTFSNYGVSSVWYTYNAGDSWSEIEGNLPDMPIRWAMFHPETSKQALLATELGVWGTLDTEGQNVFWEPLNLFLSDVRVDMLQVNPLKNEVLAATHGRGLATAIYPKHKPTAIDEKVSLVQSVGPNPCLGTLNLELDAKNEFHTIEVFNMKGQRLKHFKLAGETHLSLNLSDLEAGVLLLKLIGTDYAESKKIVLNQ